MALQLIELVLTLKLSRKYRIQLKFESTMLYWYYTTVIQGDRIHKENRFKPDSKKETIK